MLCCVVSVGDGSMSLVDLLLVTSATSATSCTSLY